MKKDVDGRIGYELVGEAEFPASATRMLYMLQGAPEGSRLPLAVFGVSDALDEFPPGTYRFLNFTKIPLFLTFNGKKSSVNPKALTSISTGVSETSGFLPFTITTRRGHKLFETHLYSQDRSRDLVFISPPEKDHTDLRIKYLSEIIPVEPVAKK